MLKFTYHTPSGDLHVVHAAPKEHIERVLGPLTDKEYKAHVLSKIPKDASGLLEITEADVPTDRTYRNAWTLNKKKIVHNMRKARDIHIEQLRQRRAPKLAQLDIDWTRAFAKGDTKTAQVIEDKRQKLRDMPSLVREKVDACNNIEALKLVDFDELA